MPLQVKCAPLKGLSSLVMQADEIQLARSINGRGTPRFCGRVARSANGCSLFVSDTGVGYTAVAV